MQYFISLFNTRWVCRKVAKSMGFRAKVPGFDPGHTLCLSFPVT